MTPRWTYGYDYYPNMLLTQSGQDGDCRPSDEYGSQYSFQVYANTLNIPLLISPVMIISSVIISVGVSLGAGYFAVWEMKKRGLDNLLREY
jgi:hypothetical protein